MIVADSPYIAGDRKRGPIAFADRVRPGFTRKHLAELFRDRGYTKGAEIGVADGRYSRTLCETIPNLELLCVDPWRAYADNPRGGPQSQHDGNLEKCRQRLAGYNVRLQRGMSMDVVKDVPYDSLDFVFIDGHHSLSFVQDDLREWSYRVRSGGHVSGHDFYDFKWAGVVDAVALYTFEKNITDWSICDEREPSFFWVKP
jgi:hypothetical protein